MKCIQNARDNNPNCQTIRKTFTFTEKRTVKCRGIFDKFECDIRTIHNCEIVIQLLGAQYAKVYGESIQNSNRIDEELNSLKKKFNHVF